MADPKFIFAFFTASPADGLTRTLAFALAACVLLVLANAFPFLALKAKGSDRRVYVLIGDGESNEGSIWEAILLAGNLGLSNLTTILIDNHSSTRVLGDIASKFEAFGWQARTVNGRDEDAIEHALAAPAPDGC